MELYLTIFDMQVRFELSRELVVLNLVFGTKEAIAFEKALRTPPSCETCGETIEDDGHLLKLCDKHRIEYLESWYNRWVEKK